MARVIAKIYNYRLRLTMYLTRFPDPFLSCKVNYDSRDCYTMQIVQISIA